MPAVLMTPPYQYFTDDDGNPLSGGKIFTYAAGSVSTPKPAYTTAAGDIELSNPIILDDAGRAVVFIDGSYKFVIKDANDVIIRTVDNVTSFTTLEEESDAFFQSFSGNGTQTAFTLSEDLGTDEKAIFVFVNDGLEQCVTNGTFTTDTGWTKGVGWSIGTGVATATGAISTAIEQNSAVTLLAGQSYVLTYTITQSAGSITPSIGGTAGTARSSSGTYVETIIAGSTQVISFGTSGFTGTLDDVTLTQAVGSGYQIQSPTAFTLTSTTLTFASAPASGTNNIYVFAPSLLVGAASSAAAAAQAAEAAALAAQAAAEIAETNAETAAASAALSAASLSGTSTSSVLIGTGSKAFTTQASKFFNVGNWLLIVSDADEANYMHGQVTAYSGTSLTVNVTDTGGSGTFTDWNITVSGTRGSIGATGATGTVNDLTGVPTAAPAVGDFAIFQDINDSNLTKKATLADILALSASGLVPIKTVTFSGASSVDFINGTGGIVFDGTYKAYKLFIIDISITSLGQVLVRTGDSGGFDSGASDYAWGLNFSDLASGGNSGDVTASAIYVGAGANIAAVANGSLSGEITLFNPADTSFYKKVQWNVAYTSGAGDPAAGETGRGARIAAGAIDRFQLLPSAGTLSGTAMLFGVSTPA